MLNKLKYTMTGIQKKSAGMQKQENITHDEGKKINSERPGNRLTDKNIKTVLINIFYIPEDNIRHK